MSRRRAARRSRLCSRLADGADGPRDFALVTPGHLTRLALVSRRGALAREAANALARHAPEFSARMGATRGQRLFALLLVAAAAAGALFAPRAATAAAFMLLSFVFLSAFILRFEAMAAARAAEPADAPPQDDADLPVYTIVVPLYREAAVLPQLLGALSALDYPAAKLDIKLVIECDDAEMLEGDGQCGEIARTDERRDRQRGRGEHHRVG